MASKIGDKTKVGEGPGTTQYKGPDAHALNSTLVVTLDDGSGKETWKKIADAPQERWELIETTVPGMGGSDAPPAPEEKPSAEQPTAPQQPAKQAQVYKPPQYTPQQRQALVSQSKRDWEDFLIDNNLEEKRGFNFGGYRRKDSSGNEYVYRDGQWARVAADPYDLSNRKARQAALQTMGLTEKQWRKMSYEDKLRAQYRHANNNTIGQVSNYTPITGTTTTRIGSTATTTMNGGVPTADTTLGETPKYNWDTHNWNTDPKYQQYLKEMQERRRLRTNSRRQWEDYYSEPRLDVLKRFEQGVGRILSDENAKDTKKEVYAPPHLIGAVSKRFV